MQTRIGLGLAVLAFVAYISLGLPDGTSRGCLAVDAARFLPAPRFSWPAVISLTAGYLASSFFAGRLMAICSLEPCWLSAPFLAGVALVGYGVAPSWWVVGSAGGGIRLGWRRYRRRAQHFCRNPPWRE
jgi:hypothetical protein